MFRARVGFDVAGGRDCPQSTSPNGKNAIAYEPPRSADDDTPQVWFVNLRTHHHVSAQLVPGDKLIEKEAYRNHRRWALENNRQMLWETLVEGIDEQRSGQGGSVNTSIKWSDDSQQVSVQVGVHKFVHKSVFHLQGGRFYRVADSDEDYGE